MIPYLEEECVGYRFLRHAAGQVMIIQASKDPVGRLAAGLLEMTERPVEYRTPTGDVRTIALAPSSTRPWGRRRMRPRSARL